LRLVFGSSAESEVADFEGPVLIQCAAGRGRSATLVVAVLLVRQVVADVPSSEALLRSIRPGVALTAVQRRLLEQVAMPARRLLG
jgi:protein-tyrosine phosphatase